MSKRLRMQRVTRDSGCIERGDTFAQTSNKFDLKSAAKEYASDRILFGVEAYAPLGFEGTLVRDGESLLLIGEQEVGIT
ncbi:MAG: hypothetical protein ABR501_12675 [Pyrinomonadaceae bacterium]